MYERVGNAVARSRASHSGRSIYRGRRYREEQHVETAHSRSGENNIGSIRGFVCECDYRCPWRAGHSPDDYRTESLSPARGRQQSCRKRRCARFFCVSLMLSERRRSDRSQRIPLVARYRLSDSGKCGFFFFYLRSLWRLFASDSLNNVLLFLRGITGICRYSINLCKRRSNCESNLDDR